MLQILIAWRFFVGIGIGGECKHSRKYSHVCYAERNMLIFDTLDPAGSVGAAESTGELKSGTRNRWFIL